MRPRSKAIHMAVAVIVISLIGACSYYDQAEKKDEEQIVQPPIVQGAANEIVATEGKGVIYGRLLDAETGKGVNGVDVIASVGGGIKTFTTKSGEPMPDLSGGAEGQDVAASDSSLSAIMNKKKGAVTQGIMQGAGDANDGKFWLINIPQGEMTITFRNPEGAAKNYIAPAKKVTVPPHGMDSSPVYVDANDQGIDAILLYPGLKTKVFVTFSGKPVPGVAVYGGGSMPTYEIYGKVVKVPVGEFGYGPSIAEMSRGDWTGMVVTGEDGIALFEAAPPTVMFVTPAGDIDGDGKYDYTTGVSNVYASGNRDDKERFTTISLMPITTPDASLYIVGRTCDKYDNVEGMDDPVLRVSERMAGVIGSESVTGGAFVRVDPCVMAQGENLSYVLSFPAEMEVKGKIVYKSVTNPSEEPIDVTVALGAANSIVIFTPAKALAANEIYKLDYAVDEDTHARGSIEFFYKDQALIRHQKLEDLAYAVSAYWSGLWPFSSLISTAAAAPAEPVGPTPIGGGVWPVYVFVMPDVALSATSFELRESVSSSMAMGWGLRPTYFISPKWIDGKVRIKKINDVEFPNPKFVPLLCELGPTPEDENQQRNVRCVIDISDISSSFPRNKVDVSINGVAVTAFKTKVNDVVGLEMNLTDHTGKNPFRASSEFTVK